MKIMIADDEVIIRNGMSTVINWRELGLELLEPAASAEEVLARIDAEKPDILITDIRMTGKTGLELAQEVRTCLPDLEIIIFTGYDDFVFMQNAIRQNVSDYLLKTSRAEDIIETVLKVKRRIEEKRAQQCQDRVHNRKRQEVALERWIVEGASDSSALHPAWPEHIMTVPGRTGESLKVVLVVAEGWNQSNGSQALLLFAVHNALGDLLPCMSFIQKKRIVLVLQNPDSEARKQHYRSALEKVERILKCSLIDIGGKAVDCLEDLHLSYLSADETYGYRRLVKASHWNYDDIRGRTGGKSICSVEEEKELASILLEGNSFLLKRWTHDFIHKLMEDGNATPQSLEAAIQSVALVTRRWLERLKASNGGEQHSSPVQPLLYDRDQVPEEELFQYVYGLMKLYHNELSASQRTHIRRAIAFIEENMGQDVSLQQTARHVHLHPGHLSALFKKETGLTYRDYVLQVKMKHAMKILRLHPAKISDVASEVGYDDVKYFGQVFKRFTGKTPSDYREDMAAKTPYSQQ